MAKKRLRPQSQPLPYLPEEIITDILSRLPVKALIKFRCVSKSWLNLISNPNFIKTHLINSSKSHNFTHHKVILWRKAVYGSPYRKLYDLKSYSLHSMFDPLSENGNFSNAHTFKLDYQYNEMVGSCNGLICIVLEKATLFIWNPSTGKSKRVVVLGKFLRHNVITQFGFGYDQLNDDYKVVRMKFDASDRRFNKNVVEVYSLRTESWRKIGDFPRSIPYPHRGKFVNGALHWIGNHEKSFVIVSLDLGNETYGEIAQPNYGDGYFNGSLIVLEGYISVCCDFSDIRADIWVMKEYGVKDSWMKLYTIPYMNILKVNEYSLVFPLCTSVTGEILLKHEERLVLYDPNHGTYRNHKFRNLLFSPQGATTYVESLVSP